MFINEKMSLISMFFILISGLSVESGNFMFVSLMFFIGLGFLTLGVIFRKEKLNDNRYKSLL